jgi:hypothetical protein
MWKSLKIEYHLFSSGNWSRWNLSVRREQEHRDCNCSARTIGLFFTKLSEKSCQRGCTQFSKRLSASFGKLISTAFISATAYSFSYEIERNHCKNHEKYKVICLVWKIDLDGILQRSVHDRIVSHCPSRSLGNTDTNTRTSSFFTNKNQLLCRHHN